MQHIRHLFSATLVVVSRQTAPDRTDRGDDAIGRLAWVHMLPDAKDLPALRFEHSRRLTVPLHVPRQLRLPVLMMSSGNIRVHRAAVPEATIDEHSETKPSEDDVRPTPPIGARSVVNPVSKALSVQDPPDCKLRLGVSSPVALHGSLRTGRRGPRNRPCTHNSTGYVAKGPRSLQERGRWPGTSDRTACGTFTSAYQQTDRSSHHHVTHHAGRAVPRGVASRVPAAKQHSTTNRTGRYDRFTYRTPKGSLI